MLGNVGCPPPWLYFGPTTTRSPPESVSVFSLDSERGGIFANVCPVVCQGCVGHPCVCTSKVCIPSGAYPTRIHYSGFSLPRGRESEGMPAIQRRLLLPLVKDVGRGRGACACVQTHTPPHTPVHGLAGLATRLLFWVLVSPPRECVSKSLCDFVFTWPQHTCISPFRQDTGFRGFQPLSHLTEACGGEVFTRHLIAYHHPLVSAVESPEK